jgi:hypothetical protein
LKRHDQPQFVLWARACKNGGVLNAMSEGLVVQRVKVSAGEDCARILQAKLPCDSRGRAGMVPSDHLYVNAGGPALSYGGDRFFARRVDQAKQAKESEPVFDIVEPKNSV